MSDISARPRRYAILGGGITGLAAAHRLTELDPAAQVTLFEASGRLGGVIETQREAGFLLERSADNFIASAEVPWALDLCRRIGFADELVPTNSDRRGAYVVFRNRLVPLPEGFTLMSPARIWPVVTTPLLSAAGKLRLACEYFVPRRHDTSDESLADFARRRLGREAYERIVQPLVGGIYTADPEKLSMQAAMPQFVALERKYGSLIAGVRRRAKSDPASQHTSGARYNLFYAPRNGLSSLIDAIAVRLPAGAVRLNSPVRELAPLPGGGWRITTSEAAEEFDALIIALPATAAARLITPFAGELASELGGIPYAGAAVVALAYRREQIAHKLGAFGYVVPAGEKRRTLAASFSSLKYPGRAPENTVLIRVFIGGALQPELAQLDDERLYEVAEADLRELIGASGQPLLKRVIRWHGAMPQYHVGHLQRVERMEQLAAKWPGLALAGSAYRGVGIPQCIRSGEQAAERIYGVSSSTESPRTNNRSGEEVAESPPV